MTAFCFDCRRFPQSKQIILKPAIAKRYIASARVKKSVIMPKKFITTHRNKNARNSRHHQCPLRKEAQMPQEVVVVESCFHSEKYWGKFYNNWRVAIATFFPFSSCITHNFNASTFLFTNSSEYMMARKIFWSFNYQHGTTVARFSFLVHNSIELSIDENISKNNVLVLQNYVNSGTHRATRQPCQNET